MRRNARRRRARLLLWSALPCLVALAFAAKLLSLNLLAGQARDAFTKDNPLALAAAANWLGTINWLEPHKAEFAQGDAHVLEGDFTAARAAFETALAYAPGADECKVRVNLVLSIEKLGDARRAAGDDTAANSQYEDGKAVVSAAPGSCFTVSAEGNADGEGERLSNAADRLASKTAAAGAEESRSEP
ncbi:hypothetical protein [Arthrobacter sp. AZCC_0090]|uniref:hypothetical protein n=1 Tax=Arthrobacter sp. AZCC_0090 TaxID=2735881 RepID=UPI001842EABE|nr:hypothetical protein [Arthrobacter sp. AZCC_0090]MBB6403219.1 hypothetical protein [Arthrobacter sp. AZCC_0090]